jgi:hypothetical protein
MSELAVEVLWLSDMSIVAFVMIRQFAAQDMDGPRPEDTLGACATLKA